MADIFEEVEEGLRQDKFTTLWKKYGVFAYLAAALLIGGVGLNEYLTYARGEALQARSAALESALEELDSDRFVEASESLAALSESDAEISAVAAHFLSQVKLEAHGDVSSASDALLDAAGKGDDPLAKLARIKAAYLKADTASLDEIRALVGDMSTEGSAFGALALELIAAKALAEGDIELARAEYNLLRVSSNVPEGVQTRVARALASLPPPAAPSESDEQPTEAAVPLEETVEDVTPEDSAEGSAGEDTTNED